MSNCTCGRTTRPPLCDGSHQMSEDSYRERCERLKKLDSHCTVNNQFLTNMQEKDKNELDRTSKK